MEQKPQPEVYTVKPIQPAEKKDGQLSQSQLNDFFNHGFLIVKDFYSKSLLDAAMNSVDELVDELANILYDAGKIKNKHKDKGFKDRLTHLEKEFPGAVVLFLKAGKLPNEIKDVWSNDKMLNVVEQLIGPDIAGHPVWNLRCKAPQNEQTTVPWHQDNAYLDPDALNVLQVTAWIPFVDANVDNGCIQVVKGGHRKGVTATHTCCHGETWYVMLNEKAMERELGVDLSRDIVTCEVERGDILLMNNAIPHRSLDNRSDMIRWSLDLRWQKPNMPNGFYGLKNSVLMRTRDNQNIDIDWDYMDNVNGTKVQKDDAKTHDFETVICGPWMKRWEITHHNKHTRALANTEIAYH